MISPQTEYILYSMCEFRQPRKSHRGTHAFQCVRRAEKLSNKVSLRTLAFKLQAPIL